MKLIDVKPIETISVHLRDPNTGAKLFDDRVPVTITLKGMHTDAFQSVLNTQQAENRKNEKRGIVKTPAQERADSAALYAAVTVAWKGIDGECTKDAAMALYEPEHMAWLRAQISDALIEHAQSIKK